jgi:hypothetical protein
MGSQKPLREAKHAWLRESVSIRDLAVAECRLPRPGEVPTYKPLVSFCAWDRKLKAPRPNPSMRDVAMAKHSLRVCGNVKRPSIWNAFPTSGLGLGVSSRCTSNNSRYCVVFLLIASWHPQSQLGLYMICINLRSSAAKCQQAKQPSKIMCF